MPDQDETQAGETQAGGLSAEISSSLASVWAKHVGERPTGAEVAINGNVVRWELKGGTGTFEKGRAALAGEDPETPAPTVVGYRRDAAAAVARATGRRVMAQITEHDEKTDLATEVFILDTRPRPPAQTMRHFGG